MRHPYQQTFSHTAIPMTSPLNSPAIVPTAEQGTPIAPPGSGDGIVLLAVAVRELIYREIPIPGGQQLLPVSPGSPLAVQTNFQGQIGLGEGGAAELTLRLELVFDHRQRPIELQAGITAQFRRPPQMSLRDFVKWLSDAGGRFLYPYFRELVSSVTARGVYGTVLLNPALLNPLLTPEELEQLLAGQSMTESS
jgi:hypothetical protein